MADLRFESTLSLEEIEDKFKDVDVFSGIMDGLKEALAYEEGMGVIWKTHLTKEEAAAYAATEWYKNKTAQEIVDFQLFEDRLCMPIDLFHKALEEALGRPVKSEEFSAKGLACLQREYIANFQTGDENK